MQFSYFDIQLLLAHTTVKIIFANLFMRKIKQITISKQTLCNRFNRFSGSYFTSKAKAQTLRCRQNALAVFFSKWSCSRFKKINHNCACIRFRCVLQISQFPLASTHIVNARKCYVLVLEYL